MASYKISDKSVDTRTQAPFIIELCYKRPIDGDRYRFPDSKFMTRKLAEEYVEMNWDRWDAKYQNNELVGYRIIDMTNAPRDVH
jgi:hypothetical protein